MFSRPAVEWLIASSTRLRITGSSLTRSISVPELTAPSVPRSSCAR